MERLASLSTGTKLMLASLILLFFDLFMTWQKVPQVYGNRFDVTDNLDAWDGWGLLVGLGTLALLSLVILRETSVELSPEVPWSMISLGIAGTLFCAATAKNVLDAHSAWASYAGVALAAVCVAGAWLDRDRVEPERERPWTQTWKPSVRASRAGHVGDAPERSAEESRTAESSGRW